MCKWIYAAFTDGDGERRQGLYTEPELFEATFSPEAVIHYETRLTARNKDEARQLAINIYESDGWTVGEDVSGNLLTYGEYAYIADALENLGRRFGLLREFRENGIL